jgi:hypothetical protein
LLGGAGSAEETAFLATARDRLARIPGVEGFAISRQVSPKSDLTFQFAMSFADQATYDAYNVHPNHVEFVASRWDVEVDEFQEYDFVAV